MEKKTVSFVVHLLTASGCVVSAMAAGKSKEPLVQIPEDNASWKASGFVAEKVPKSFFRKSWIPRFCVLTMEGELLLAEGKEESMIARRFHVSQAKMVKVKLTRKPAKRTAIGSSSRCEFRICTSSGQKLSFLVSSHEEAMYWCNNLIQLCGPNWTSVRSLIAPTDSTEAFAIRSKNQTMEDFMDYMGVPLRQEYLERKTVSAAQSFDAPDSETLTEWKTPQQIPSQSKSMINLKQHYPIPVETPTPPDNEPEEEAPLDSTMRSETPVHMYGIRKSQDPSDESVSLGCVTYKEESKAADKSCLASEKTALEDEIGLKRDLGQGDSQPPVLQLSRAVQPRQRSYFPAPFYPQTFGTAQFSRIQQPTSFDNRGKSWEWKSQALKQEECRKQDAELEKSQTKTPKPNPDEEDDDLEVHCKLCRSREMANDSKSVQTPVHSNCKNDNKRVENMRSFLDEISSVLEKRRAAKQSWTSLP